MKHNTVDHFSKGEQTQFIQPHKSYFVNLTFVRAFDLGRNVVIMDDGQEYPIAPSGRTEIRRVIKMDDNLIKKVKTN